MIVGKNAAKLGFTWYVKTIVKCVSGIAIIGLSIPAYVTLAVFGLIVLALGVYESWNEYKVLSANKPIISGDYKHNVSKDDNSDGYYPDQTKDETIK